MALSGAVVIGFSGLFCVLVKHYNYRKSHKKQRRARNLKFAPLPSERACSNNNLMPSLNNGIAPHQSTLQTAQLHKIAEPMKGHTWRHDNNTLQQLNDEARLMTEEQR